MEDKIHKLKVAGAAYNIANIFDSCQSKEKVDDIMENYDIGTKEIIEEACDQYEGYSPGDMTSVIIDMINNL